MLILATLAFVGSHFLMSHPLRRKLSGKFGEGGFAAVYSIVSLALFFWMIVEFGNAPKAVQYWAVSDLHWAAASALTLVAAVLFIGSLVRNPSLPGASDNLAAQKPSGVFKVTRHPMMWGFALWGVAHIVVAPRVDNFIFCGGIIFLALIGSKAQERKKARMIGVGWGTWLRQTSFFPRVTALASIGPVPWVAGTVLWLAATWAHPYMGVAGAGLFRWLSV